MAVIGVDIGGTTLALAIFSEAGEVLQRDSAAVGGRGRQVEGALLLERLHALLDAPVPDGDRVRAVGISVPGIHHADRGRGWAPNLPGWVDSPLLDEVQASVGANLRVSEDSDRAAYIPSNVWRGTARCCRNAIFVVMRTGIGAGHLVPRSLSSRD